MTDYTPSTDEVRDAYAGHDFDQAIAGAQFDRWLDAQKAKWQAEAYREAEGFLLAEERHQGQLSELGNLCAHYQQMRARVLAKTLGTRASQLEVNPEPNKICWSQLTKPKEVTRE